MSLPLRLAALIPFLGPAFTPGAEAQDFPDVQVFTNRVLFAKQAADQREREAERRRVEELGQRTEQQAAMLQTQADAVRQLDGELRQIRGERQILDIAQTFDAAIVARRFLLVRPLLTATVTVDLGGGASFSGTLSADDFVARLPALTAGSGILPRSNQRVQINGSHATLTSDGYAWNRPVRSRDALDRYAGKYEYGFEQAPDGWKLVELSFQPYTP